MREISIKNNSARMSTLSGACGLSISQQLVPQQPPGYADGLLIRHRLVDRMCVAVTNLVVNFVCGRLQDKDDTDEHSESLAASEKAVRPRRNAAVCFAGHVSNYLGCPSVRPGRVTL